MRRKLAVVLCSLVAMFWTALPAMADHASPTNNDYYNGPQGPITLSGKTFCLSDTLLNNVSGAQEAEIRDRIEEVSSHVVNQTQMDYDFDVEASGSCSGTLNFVQRWNDSTGSTVNARVDSFCAGLNGGQSRVTFGHLNDLELESEIGNPVAMTIACDTNLNGFIDWQFIAFENDPNRSCGGTDNFPCYKYDGTPSGSQKYHFKGLFLHEFMHGVGFWGHFVSTGDACDSPKNTMCAGTSAFLLSTAGATLESHDIGETNENY